MSVVEELLERVQPTFEFMGYLLRIFERRSLHEKNFFQNSLGYYALSCLRSSGFDIAFEELKNWLKQRVNDFLDGKEPMNKLFESDNFLALCIGIKALRDFDKISLNQKRMDSLKKIVKEIIKRTWLEDIRNPSVFLFSFSKKEESVELTAIAKENIERNYTRFKAEENVPQQIYSILGLSCLDVNLDDDVKIILERHELDTTLLSILLLSSKEKTNKNRIYHDLVNNLQSILDTFRPYMSDFLSTLQMKKLDFDEGEMNAKVDLIKIKNTSRWKFEVELLKSLKSINFIEICFAIIGAYHADLLKTYGMISKDQVEIFRKGKDIQRGFFPFNRAELSLLILLLYIPVMYSFFVLLPSVIGWYATIGIFLLTLELVYSFLREGSLKRDKLYTLLRKAWDKLSKTVGK